jgi:hypothetical protein
VLLVETKEENDELIFGVHKILTEGVFVIGLSTDAGISF